MLCIGMQTQVYMTQPHSRNMYFFARALPLRARALRFRRFGCACVAPLLCVVTSALVWMRSRKLLLLV